MQEIQETWVWSLQGRSPGGGNGNPLKYSCLEHSMDRGAWWESMQVQRAGHDWAHTHTHSLKLTRTFFHRTRASYLKIYMGPWTTQNCKSILREKNKDGGITLPDFRQYYIVTVINTVWYWHKSRHMDQWNRVQSSEINSNSYSQLIFHKGDKIIQWKKDSLFK